jgi:hypothetical protein
MSVYLSVAARMSLSGVDVVRMLSRSDALMTQPFRKRIGMRFAREPRGDSYDQTFMRFSAAAARRLLFLREHRRCRANPRPIRFRLCRLRRIGRVNLLTADWCAPLSPNIR